MEAKDSIDLISLNLRDYFRSIIDLIDDSLELNELTRFFTNEPFNETKPYLCRRALVPIDKRFKKIEIVYSANNKIEAIVWDLSVSLNELIDCFGEPISQYLPYDDSTGFRFRHKNPKIKIIETRFPEWLTKLEKEDGYQTVNESGEKIKIENPKFTFIQISLN